MQSEEYNSENNINEIRETLFKFISFWPYILVSLIFSLFITFFYLKYEPTIYSSTAKIQILDDAMDSDMALPTAMTIFNRSTVNLENEIEVIKSNRIIDQVVKEMNLNRRFFSLGRINETEYDSSEWLSGIEYNLEFNSKADEIYNSAQYDIEFENDFMQISKVSSDKKESYKFSEFSTYNKKTELPFDLKIIDRDLNRLSNNKFKIIIEPISFTVLKLKSSLQINQIGLNSDLLSLTYNHSNPQLLKNFR